MKPLDPQRNAGCKLCSAGVGQIIFETPNHSNPGAVTRPFSCRVTGYQHQPRKEVSMKLFDGGVLLFIFAHIVLSSLAGAF